MYPEGLSDEAMCIVDGGHSYRYSKVKCGRCGAINYGMLSYLGNLAKAAKAKAKKGAMEKEHSDG